MYEEIGSEIKLNYPEYIALGYDSVHVAGKLTVGNPVEIVIKDIIQE